MPSRDLKVTLVGEDRTGRAFDAAAGNAGRFGAAVGVAAVAATAAFAAFAVKGVKDAAAVDAGLREVNSLFGLTGPAAQASFKQLQAGVAGVSAEVGIAQDKLTKGLYTAISAGVPRENAFTFLRDSAKLGIAGVADTQTAVNALTGVLNAFKRDSLSSTQAADLLFMTVRQGKTTLAELSPAIGTVGPAAAAAGVSFRDTAAALASVTKVIPNTATAAASLRQVFAESDKTGTKFNTALRELGVKTMGEAVTKFGSFQGVLQKVFEQSGSSEVAFKNLFGSVEAGGAALTLVGTNAKTAAADLDAMRNAGGASEQAFNELNQSASRSFEQLKVGLQNIGIQLGNKFLPVLSSVTTWASQHLPAAMSAASTAFADVRSAVTPVIAVFTAVADHWQTITTVVLAGVAVMSPVILLLGAQLVALGVFAVQSGVAQVGAWLSTQAAAVGSAAAAYAASLRVVGGWVLMGAQALLGAAKVAAAWLIAIGPIALVVAAVAAVVFVIVKNWDTIKAATSAAWTAVVSFITGAWESIKGVVSGALAAVGAAFTFYFTAYRTVVSVAWDTIKAVFTAAVNVLRAVVIDGLGDVLGFFRSLPGRITGALGDLGGLLTSAGRAVVESFIRGIEQSFRAVKDTLGKLTSLLPDWKGPASRDAMILRGSGQLVMAGFEQGLRDQFGSIRQTLGDATDLLSLNMPGGSARAQAALAGRTGPVERVPLIAPVDRTDEMLALLAEQNELLRRLPREYQLGQRQGG